MVQRELSWREFSEIPIDAVFVIYAYPDRSFDIYVKASREVRADQVAGAYERICEYASQHVEAWCIEQEQYERDKRRYGEENL